MPFSVVNRPIIDTSGHAAVAAERTFRLNGGERTMVDAITAHPTGLIDFLGAARRYAASFEAVMSRAGLELRSTRLAVRFGQWHVAVPRQSAHG